LQTWHATNVSHVTDYNPTSSWHGHHTVGCSHRDMVLVASEALMMDLQQSSRVSEDSIFKTVVFFLAAPPLHTVLSTGALPFMLQSSDPPC